MQVKNRVMFPVPASQCLLVKRHIFLLFLPTVSFSLPAFLDFEDLLDLFPKLINIIFLPENIELSPSTYLLLQRFDLHISLRVESHHTKIKFGE